MMDELLKIALVGSGKAPVPGETRGAADALGASARAPSQESALLLRAGADAVYRMAGRLAPRLDPPEPAPDEDRPPCPSGIAALLQSWRSRLSRELLAELLARMERAGLRIAPEALPSVLDEREPDLRAAIRPVLGRRGEWLARLNPDWQWAVPVSASTEDEEVAALRSRWDEGALDERVEVLRRLRELRPSDAWDWLREALPAEKADRRAKLLELLEVGLSAEDEAFLEGMLEDRSEAVRSTAAQLLARLPGSAYRARMLERADAMLEGGRGGLLRKKATLSCVPPKSIDKDWTRDGVSAKAPAGMGQRAWWIQQVLSTVDLGHWESRFGATPQELVAAADETEYGGAIVAGWIRSACLSLSVPGLGEDHARAWVPWLWEHAMKDKKKRSGYETNALAQDAIGLLSVIPQADAESLVLAQLEHGRLGKSGWGEAVLRPLRTPWSAGFARAFFDRLKRASQFRDAGWAAEIYSMPLAVPAECFEEALKLAETHSEKWGEGWRRAMTEFVDTIRIRKTIVEEMPCER